MVRGNSLSHFDDGSSTYKKEPVADTGSFYEFFYELRGNLSNGQYLLLFISLKDIFMKH